MAKYNVGDVIRITEPTDGLVAGSLHVVVEVDPEDDDAPVRVLLPDGDGRWPAVGRFEVATRMLTVPAPPGLVVELDSDGDLSTKASEADLTGVAAARRALKAFEGARFAWLTPGSCDSGDLRQLAAVALLFAEALDSDKMVADRQLAADTGLSVSAIERLRKAGYTITKEA